MKVFKESNAVLRAQTSVLRSVENNLASSGYETNQNQLSKVFVEEIKVNQGCLEANINEAAQLSFSSEDSEEIAEQEIEKLKKKDRIEFQGLVFDLKS